MNGAQALVRTLVGGGVTACFANPGTSEMHFVAALDAVPEMRGILCLFEGVATGAADGYGRMADRPAATLLHLGPGLANGLANLHNARRAHTPVVNVVGDHATYHKRFDAPLESDLDALAGSVSGWVRRSSRAADVGADAADAVLAARTPPGQVATVLLPADASWSEGGQPVPVPAPHPPGVVPDATVRSAAAALRSGEPCVLLAGGAGARRAGIAAATRVAAATGARLYCETFPPRHPGGADVPTVARLGYLAEMASSQLEGARHLILAGARRPVTFFAYPGKPSDLVPDGCAVHVLAEPGEDVPGALEHLADLLGAPPAAPVEPVARPEPPTGDLTAQSMAAAVAALLPEGAIVSDEANTSGIWLAGSCAGAAPHDWLMLTGGSIGQGMPVATGAAVACPSRSVLSLESDGSAMYTITALWTQAREGLDVTTVVLNNRSYAILNMELARVGAGAGGAAAKNLLDLARPDLDFVGMARGMGVPASRAQTAEEFSGQLARAFAEPGPHLIEAVLPSMFGP